MSKGSGGHCKLIQLNSRVLSTVCKVKIISIYMLKKFILRHYINFSKGGHRSKYGYDFVCQK